MLLEECIKEKVYESSPRTQTISGESFQSCGLVKIYRTANVSEQPTRNETVQGGGSLGNALPTLVTRLGARIPLSDARTSSSRDIRRTERKVGMGNCSLLTLMLMENEL